METPTRALEIVATGSGNHCMNLTLLIRDMRYGEGNHNLLESQRWTGTSMMHTYMDEHMLYICFFEVRKLYTTCINNPKDRSYTRMGD